MMKTLRVLLVVLFPALFPAIAAAHDFWIEPSTFRPTVHSTVAIRLRVGQDFLGDPVPRRPSPQLIHFEATDVKGTTPLIGVEGEDPAGIAEVERDGMTLVVYNSTPSYVELPDDKLAQYLRDEGLEKVLELRNRPPYAGQPWREIYSRCVKALLWTGRGPSEVYKKTVGMPLELIPEHNPYALKAGGTLPVKLLYRGKPLPGALVVAIPKLDPTRRIALRSDAKGQVRFKLPAGGDWLIKAVHLVPAQPGGKAQWESFWASLTFALPQ
jgi:uncharacterized GH25 family protein